MPHAEGCRHADRDHGHCQPDAEAEHQGNTKDEMPELQAEQQDGDGGGARDQAAIQAEEDDLPGGYLAGGEPATDVVGVRTLMGILEAGRGYIQTLVMVVVPMLLEGAPYSRVCPP